MTCADYRAAAGAHLDGEFTGWPDALGDLDPHPVQCADCAGWRAAAERLRGMTLAARGPSPQWSARLVARVVEETGDAS